MLTFYEIWQWAELRQFLFEAMYFPLYGPTGENRGEGHDPTLREKANGEFR